MLRRWIVRFAGVITVFALAGTAGVALAAVAAAPSAPTRTSHRAHARRRHHRRSRRATHGLFVANTAQFRLERSKQSDKTLGVTITSGPANPSTTGSATFTWTTSGSISGIACSLDGGSYAFCTSGKSYSGLGSGSHTFTVRVTAGNRSAAANMSWTVNLSTSTSTTTTTTATTTTPTTTTTATTTTPTTTTTATTTTPTTTTTTTTTTPTTTTTTTTPSPIPNTFGRSLAGIAAGGAIQNETSTDLNNDLNIDQSTGASWVRIDINWAQIQNGGPSSYDWSNIDSVVQGAESRGLRVLGGIVYTPSWARPSGTSATYGPNPSTYAAFASAAVAHYSAMGVHAYEIWNEENTVSSWTPAPNPAAYAALLKAAYPAIKAADPSATVITGGLSPAPNDGTNIAPVTFLSDIYAAGAEGSFDAVGAHPYCWPAMPGDTDTWSAWYQMYGTSPSLRSVMEANGDSAKKIWGTEYGAPTNGPSGTYVSEATQASMISQAIQLWGSYSWAGPLFIYQGRDLGTDTSSQYNFFGLTNYDGTPKPSFGAYQQAVQAL
jgi:hypothetical protein